MVFKLCCAFLLIAGTAPVLSPGQAPVPIAPAGAVQTYATPEHALKFSPVDMGSGSTIAISPATSLPQCDADGALFLDLLDPRDPRKHSVVSFKGKEHQTYSPAAIPDLHDVFVLGFYPTSSKVAFLVRAAKDLPGNPGPGQSPAGIPWSRYHTYVAEFNRDGSYKGKIELPISYKVVRFAIFPSGEFLVIGYDELNSVVRMLLLSSSGDVVRTIDLPASRTAVAGDTPFRSPAGARAASKVLASLMLTPYNQDILAWRTNSNDPILDVTPGGGVREVPLQVPAGFAFAGMIPSSDRWIAHFRAENIREDAPFTASAYSYFELRPQDGSVSSKLVISGDIPQSLACESDGTYLTYKVDSHRNLILLTSN